MARAIDAEVLESTIVGSLTIAGAMNEQYKPVFDVMATEIKKIIDEQPTIEPTKHGKWNEVNACALCGCQPWFERDIHTLNYCPNCGARMDGENE